MYHLIRVKQLLRSLDLILHFVRQPQTVALESQAYLASLFQPTLQNRILQQLHVLQNHVRRADETTFLAVFQTRFSSLTQADY